LMKLPATGRPCNPPFRGSPHECQAGRGMMRRFRLQAHLYLRQFGKCAMLDAAVIKLQISMFGSSCTHRS
jgi:hypothetical protein